MKELYVLTHIIYSYEDHDFSSKVELFSTLEDAIIYYELIKDNIIDEYFKYSGNSTLENFSEDEYAYYAEHAISLYPRLYIQYDEFGSDELKVEKKSILNFEEGLVI